MGSDVFRHDNIDPGMLFSCFLDQFRDVPGHVGACLQKKRDNYDPLRLLSGAALQSVLRCRRDILEKSVFDMSVGAGLFDLFNYPPDRPISLIASAPVTQDYDGSLHEISSCI